MADSSGKVISDPDHIYLVKSVYQTTWNDFYDWEQAYCLQTLRSLARVPPQDASYSGEKNLNGVDTYSRSLALRRSQVSDYDYEIFTVIDYSVDGEAETAALPVVTVKGTRPFEPCAPYEICTPVNRNISVGDDSHYMPFIPLIDDPTFNALRHAEDYNYFQWQMPHRDPDLEAIVTEAVYNLHRKHQLSFQAIDETEILPFPSQSPALPRDFPKWLAMHSPLPHLSSHANASGPERLASLASNFCSNMNCLTGFCTVHMADMPMPESVRPTIPSNDLVYTVLQPCGSDCFLLKNVSYSVPPWSDGDVEALTTVLSLSPDLSPCHLAIICRKPCFEVYKRRRRLFPDSLFSKVHKPTEKNFKRSTRRLKFDDHIPTIFTPNPPCSHSGPCDASSGCPCFKNNAHCERSCRCDRKCPRRWHGCTCSKAKQEKICRTTRCSCFRARRECDPELCTKCEARYFESDICKNISIQRSDRKRTQVRQSKWGLGLYIDEEAQEDDFILEYTGEIVYEITSLCRDFVSRHRKRCYLYTLNPTHTIDSTKAGNESRFINHDSNPNCYGKIKLVNGEHRIGIFACCHILPGTELSLDYGDSFFEDGADAAADNTSRRSMTPPDFASDQVILSLDQHSSDATYADSESGTPISDRE
ncbi:hypothetical protein H2248_006737 [Termitomyces sp. 'cryptogamus']|nr:hypothetical protein H2248_006737 [Termitomyces sp. 'cryptogamus']